MTFLDIVFASAVGQLVAIGAFCVATAIYRLGLAVAELNALRQERNRKDCTRV